MKLKRHGNQNRSNDEARAAYRRRHVLAVGAGMAVAMLAGCATETALNDPADGTSTGDADSGASAAGTFRLLISDQPVAIDDFDELNVSFDRARIFRAEGTDESEVESDDDDEAEIEAESEDDNPDSEVNATEVDDDTVETDGNETAVESDDDEGENETDGNETEVEVEAEAEDDGPEDGDQRGFYVIDLDGATVDLTQVIGDRAIGVFEGELEEGRYSKIELYAADVEGIVDEEVVDVMIPSGKLQIVKPFEVVAGETLSYVFDINVVKKGPGQEYNLLPVISESGVAGEDVPVEEIGGVNADSIGEGGSESDTEASEDSEDDEDSEGKGEGQGPPDETGQDS